MMSLRRLAATALAVALVGLTLAALVLVTGCRKEEEVFLDTNLAPDTELTSAPGPLSQANYRVHLYWSGTDPDGYIDAYYFAWDNTTDAWVYTTRNDSLFKALIDTTGETRRHTFYVRAVDNEGKLDPSPARIRFDAWTVVPVIDSLRRLDGPMDPQSVNYNPGYKDTVLMGSTCTFRWTGEDPDGMGAGVRYAYRLDSNPFSEFQEETTATMSGISSGTHFFYVKGEDETGAESYPSSYKFVMNYEPDSEIVQPPEPSETLTVPDNTRVVFRWTTRDREELEGVYGGVSEVWIELDGEILQSFDVGSEDYQEHWMLTADTTVAGQNGPHYVDNTKNYPTGGNFQHEFRVYARDVEGRFEFPSRDPDDRERYKFWYNFPPETEILEPADGETLCPEFTISWIGTDVDGSIQDYQYVLDPGGGNSWKTSEDTFLEASLVDSAGVAEVGWHEFRVRSRDSSGCWEEDYNAIQIYVEECE